MGLWCVPLVRCRPLARFRSQSTLVVLAGRASNGVRLPIGPSLRRRAVAADTFTLQKA